jgi:hypothetical protein
MVTYTHSDYVILLDLHENNGYTNVNQSYVTRTLPLLRGKDGICIYHV